MNKILLGLNILLVVAVAYLLADKWTAKPDMNAPANPVTTEQGLHIVYVNADTLLNQYGLFQEKQKAISERGKTADASLKAQARALEREIMMLNEKASKGTMTPKDLQAEEQRLTAKQQQLMADQDRISKELMEESSKINDELQSEIQGVLRIIQAQYGYDFVLSYGSGSPVLAVNDSLEITQDVLDRLNKPGSN